jgi:hypothetical protein
MLPAVEPYKGGARWMAIAGIVGLVGLAVTVFGFFGEGTREEAYHSYLAAFAYFFAIAVGGLIFLMILHATHAVWPTVLRRAVEAVPAALPIFVLLFIPVLTGMSVLFKWTNPEANFTPLELHHFHGSKSLYLNTTFFYVRQVIYFAVMLFVSWRLLGFSRRLDDEGGHELIARSRRFASGAIPFVGLALTWASFDWLMSLTPFWQSTIYGVYYFAGGFLCSIALVTLFCVAERGDRNHFGHWLTAHHHHNLGKLMLAFTAFWAYIGFSQFMLVWIANLPEEVPYFWVRIRTDWRPISQFLIFGHFALPFALLLPRTTKLIPRYLGAVAVWILFVGAVDVWWLVMPAIHPDGPHLSLFTFSSYLGVGGIAVAFGLWRARGRYMIPVRDPYLEASLRYMQP